MNGNSPQKKPLEASLSKQGLLVLEVFLLMMAGAFAIFLHHKLRTPLNTPGHHGLEFMMIFVVLRLSSNLRYAATLAVVGTGLFIMLPGYGASTPLHSVSYLLPGLVLDFFYNMNRNTMHRVIALTLISGLAYMSIPLSRLVVVAATGFPYNAFLKFGIFYTVLSFFAFGMIGGLLGFGLDQIRKSFNTQNKTH